MKLAVIVGALLGLTSVIMGAASDHLFSGIIAVETAGRLDVALRYHQLYAILIFCMAIFGLRMTEQKTYRWSVFTFIGGTIIFCGSLYASVFPSMERLTCLTPLGGLTLMAGWGLALWSVIKQRSS